MIQLLELELGIMSIKHLRNSVISKHQSFSYILHVCFVKDLSKNLSIFFSLRQILEISYWGHCYKSKTNINNNNHEQFGFRYFPIIFFGGSNLFSEKLNRNLPAIFYLLSFFL